MHLGGKISMQSKIPVMTRNDLSIAYTPGVAKVCTAIAEDENKAYALTVKRNTVAVVGDGTAVLGLGDIGPKAAMPVMEGKAQLFKAFADVDAWPICLDCKTSDEIVAVVKAIAPVLAALIWKIFRPHAASKSNNVCAKNSTSQSSTTTNTVPPW